MKRSSTFCILPWVHLATNSGGSLRVCCNSTPGENILMKPDGTPFRLYEDDLKQAWNSELMVRTRSEMIAGQEPKICQRCFTEEKSGVVSARMRWNERWSSDEEHEKQPAFSPRYIDLRLGNLCNLKCRMCNPYASSKWVSEWNKVVSSAQLVPKEPLSEGEIQRLSKMNWMEDEKTWSNLSAVMENVEEIYLTGGEPLLIKQQFEFLKRLVQRGLAGKLILKYNTNLTRISDPLIEIWKNFKTIRLNASIDGFGETNSYIRYPSVWTEIVENLTRLHLLQQENKRIVLNIHTTVQSYNVLALDKLFLFLKEGFGIFPYLNILNHPYCLNIRNLPAPLKALAEERLSPFLDRKAVDEVVAYMKQEASDERFNEFIEFTDRCDALRNQSFLKLCPEFTPFWTAERTDVSFA